MLDSGRVTLALRSSVLVEQTLNSNEVVDASETARAAGLYYVREDSAGFKRRRAGKGFTYQLANGERVAERPQVARIRSLAVPPAWTDVWISSNPRGHIQATGRDARGRKQYRYHTEFREVRDSAKFQHLVAFAEALPRIRAQVKADMALPELPREKVVATVVDLLETTLIRVGNADYARDNKSYGLTTLNNAHIKIKGTELRFRFTGKSGRAWRVKLKSRRVAKVLRACQELPGQQLFQYEGANGEIHNVTSTDVNDYLRAASGLDISAKDFRTWAGTVEAAWALNRAGAGATEAEAKRKLKTVLVSIAARLGNTVSICRKCYVHPQIIDSYLRGRLALASDAATSGQEGALRPEEGAVLPLLVRAAKMPTIAAA
jgi:DNA topoisomerase I